MQITSGKVVGRRVELDADLPEGTLVTVLALEGDETFEADPETEKIGQALYAAQQGETDPAAKPLKGFGGARVMEIVDRHDTTTYRAVYTAQFEEAIYVLHVFQKKAKRGAPRRSTRSI